MQITYHGITRDHKDWAKFLGISEQTMRWRVKHWGVSRAVTTTKVAPSKRKRRQHKVPTIAEKTRAVRSYVRGASEDDIAADIGISRRELSRFLLDWGLKRKGSAPERVAGSKTRVRTTPRRIHITIAAA